MKTFSGFASGANTVSIPEQFFSELLPLIDDVLELKVTLACLRQFDQKSGLAKWTTPDELGGDPMVAAGLAKAIERGSIVEAVDRSGGRYLFLNDELGRAAAESIKHGGSIEEAPAVQLRPNIFTLYEQSIGSLSPLIADQLRDAEKEFAPQVIEEAFAEAARQNVRSWAYVRKILDSRGRKGKRDETRGRDVAADWQRVLKKDQRPR
ncbi:MAG: DnaD domain protein [Thermoflexales bacterium]|nr:DnaD domain protein [Thermoflexales bacterium]